MRKLCWGDLTSGEAPGRPPKESDWSGRREEHLGRGTVKKGCKGAMNLSVQRIAKRQVHVEISGLGGECWMFLGEKNAGI